VIYKSLLRHKLVCDGNEYPPSGVVVRIPSSVEFDKGNAFEYLQQDETNLPPRVENVLYIVPKIIAILCKDREDLVSPVGTIKGGNMGDIQACQYLARVVVR